MNLRLVADADNLPVKYMTQDSLTYKDITGYKRPGGIDQRDAGAYQSISDKVTVKNIGTSSADFTPDYATPSLWVSDYYDNANILNGETNVLRLKNGEEHYLAMNLTLDGDADVNQSFILSGQSPHYGNLDSAAKAGVLRSNPSYAYVGSIGLFPYKNSVNITYRDFGLDTQTSASNYVVHSQTYFLRDRGGATLEERTQIAPEHNITYDRCMFNFDPSNVDTTLARYNVYGYLTDSEGNVVERSQINIKAINSTFISRGNVSGSPSVYGYLSLGDNQFYTNAQMNVDYRGCTFVNSYVGNGRFGGDNFSMSAIGCLMYMSEGAYAPGTTWPRAFVDQAVTNSDLDKVILQDCITNLRSDYFVYTRFNRDYLSRYSQEASAVFTNINMSYEVPFNFDGQYSPSTVVFDLEGQDNIYKLRKDSFGLDYVTNASALPLYDIAGVLRDSDPNAGAYEGFYLPGVELAFGNVYINLYN